MSHCPPQCLMYWLVLKIDTVAHSPEQNIAPGTVIDSTVVHPARSEFYLCPHRALQVSRQFCEM